MRIYKYVIPISEKFVLSLPKDAKILSFQLQNEDPCIWVLLEENEAEVNRYFSIYGTGHDILESETLEYIGTLQAKFGTFVWHLFEILEPKENG